MRIPVNQPYVITTKFGVPDSNALFGKHSGVDYAVPLNRRVFAPASGQLENVNSPTGGKMVRIFDGKMYHRLMHNNSFSRIAGRVNEGDEVALAGTTGLSTGVHVHWDVASKMIPTSFSDFVNPEEYIKQGDNMAKGVITTDNEIAELFRFGLGFREPTAQELKDFQWTKGKYFDDVMAYLRGQPAHKQVVAQYKAGAGSKVLSPGSYIVK